MTKCAAIASVCLRARETVAVGKISGAVGAFAHLDPVVEEKVCARLGLKAAPVSTQIIQRDRYAEFLSTLAIIASSLDKFALNVRHWQRTEVREAQEHFTAGPEGFERDAAQAKSDYLGAHLRHSPSCQGKSSGRPGERCALARTRYFTFLRRARRVA